MADTIKWLILYKYK